MQHDTDQLWTEIRELRGEVKEVRQSMTLLKQEVTKYKGFIGGVLFAASAVSTFVGFLMGHLTGK